MNDQNVSKKSFIVYAVMVSLMLASQAASADELGKGICDVVNLLTGKWLFGFTLLATLGSGAAVLFGAELSEFLKKIASIISVVGIIMVTGQLLTMAFSKFGSAAC